MSKMNRVLGRNEGRSRDDRREDVVDADDAVRSRGAAVVNDRRVTLHPDPAAALRQEPIVLGGRLAFQQDYTQHHNV